MGWCLRHARIHASGMYIRERLPYWFSCDVRAHKFHERNLVFKDHFLSNQLEALCRITTNRSVTV